MTKTRISRWRRVARGLVLLVLVALVGGMVAETVRRRGVAKTYPPRGTLVPIGDRSLQLDCRGQGAPVVVFEAGLDNLGSLSWSAVHDSVAVTTRACAYSRAGILWSDRAPGGFSLERVATDLHSALQAAGEQGPFVMVAHSLGGPFVMNFAARYPDAVGGVVMVDASHPDQMERLTAVGVPVAALQPPVMMMRVAGVLAATGVLQLVSRPDTTSTFPADVRRLSHAYQAQSMAEVRDEGLALSDILAGAGRNRNLDLRPLVVLTAERPAKDEDLRKIGMTRDQEVAMRMEWLAMQLEMAGWSRRSRHESVADASHYIQFDRPDVVIRAIQEVVRDVRALNAEATSE